MSYNKTKIYNKLNEQKAFGIFYSGSCRSKPWCWKKARLSHPGELGATIYVTARSSGAIIPFLTCHTP